MHGTTVVVSVNTSNPMILGEFETSASAIIINFGVQDQALFDIISGSAEASALLPMQMPADMATVERQAEDVPFDVDLYVDANGTAYDFGMNWTGVIKDEHIEKSVKHKPLLQHKNVISSFLWAHFQCYCDIYVLNIK